MGSAVFHFTSFASLDWPSRNYFTNIYIFLIVIFRGT
uniref:Uncharacterized protein n=1 Tax=Anguilla anguilla TaxID=7936 RepID=A0A0E9RE78_ANGAN